MVVLCTVKIFQVTVLFFEVFIIILLYLLATYGLCPHFLQVQFEFTLWFICFCCTWLAVFFHYALFLSEKGCFVHSLPKYSLEKAQLDFGIAWSWFNDRRREWKTYFEQAQDALDTWQDMPSGSTHRKGKPSVPGWLPARNRSELQR